MYRNLKKTFFIYNNFQLIQKLNFNLKIYKKEMRKARKGEKSFIKKYLYIYT